MSGITWKDGGKSFKDIEKMMKEVAKDVRLNPFEYYHAEQAAKSIISFHNTRYLAHVGEPRVMWNVEHPFVHFPEDDLKKIISIGNTVTKWGVEIYRQYLEGKYGSREQYIYHETVKVPKKKAAKKATKKKATRKR